MIISAVGLVVIIAATVIATAVVLSVGLRAQRVHVHLDRSPE